jgi:hypothetical protein
MGNAPAGKLNLPLLRRLERIQEALNEIMGSVPWEKAVTQIPPERAREFSTIGGQWWSSFTQASEQRWKTECPQLPPPRAKTIPLAERDLSRTDRAVLDWLRTKSEPVTIAETAVAVHINPAIAGSVLNKLIRHDLAKTVGLLDDRKTFVAISVPPMEVVV